mgnify:FL=1
MHPLKKAFGCLVYAAMVMFVFCYIAYIYYDENVIRKFLYDHWDRSIEVDWDAIPIHRRRA